MYQCSRFSFVMHSGTNAARGGDVTWSMTTLCDPVCNATGLLNTCFKPDMPFDHQNGVLLVIKIDQRPFDPDLDLDLSN
ncbi:hypothetical protein OUZ56_005578 [Daphnia magna]|uniref:Uncharacterized protein n=1 Tax=Daphnia magna TaxID=35525 RepID=A0ABQ9YT95_9CRUS|nr:hypothetical protein OUZ56_005578 [Daphnia magna]